MTSEEFDPMSLAIELRTAERECKGVRLPTERWPEFSFDDARQVARACDQLRIDEGDRLIGYKLGWTSAAMREALGIDQPNWGTLWESQILDATLSLNDRIHPKAEPEFVYVAGADLEGEVTTEEVAEAAAGWAVGIEVVDPRFPSFSFDWLDNTADNSSAAGIRTSRYKPSERIKADPKQFELTYTDGIETHSGDGERVMGSPLKAVAWLVQQLATEKEGLKRGQIVYTGGVTAPFDLTTGFTYTVSSKLIGNTTLHPN